MRQDDSIVCVCARVCVCVCVCVCVIDEGRPRRRRARRRWRRNEDGSGRAHHRLGSMRRAEAGGESRRRRTRRRSWAREMGARCEGPSSSSTRHPSGLRGCVAVSALGTASRCVLLRRVQQRPRKAASVSCRWRPCHIGAMRSKKRIKNSPPRSNTMALTTQHATARSTRFYYGRRPTPPQSNPGIIQGIAFTARDLGRWLS